MFIKYNNLQYYSKCADIFQDDSADADVSPLACPTKIGNAAAAAEASVKLSPSGIIDAADIPDILKLDKSGSGEGDCSVLGNVILLIGGREPSLAADISLSAIKKELHS